MGNCLNGRSQLIMQKYVLPVFIAFMLAAFVALMASVVDVNVTGDSEFSTENFEVSDLNGAIDLSNVTDLLTGDFLEIIILLVVIGAIIGMVKNFGKDMGGK